MNNDYQEPQEQPDEQTVPPSEPPRNEPPMYQPAPEQRQTRRIGTLTMGAALIATGVIALIATFYPSFDLTNVFKLSPIIFIFLGLEILISYFFSKGMKLRYDFLSGFVCFVLICGGLGLSVIPTLWNYAGPPAMETRLRLHHEIENALYEALSDEREINSLSVNAETGLPYDFGDIGIETLSEQINVYVNIDLAGPYADKNAFAASCARILERVKTLPYRFVNITLSHESRDGRFSLGIDDRFQLNMDAARLAGLVEIVRFDYDDEGNRNETYPDEWSELPEASIAPEVPEAPDAPEAPEAPAAPESPDAPESPVAPESLVVPEAPSIPGMKIS